jgi:hypothetical protein
VKAACTIIRLELMNAQTDAIIRTLTDGTEICDDRSISIKAVTDQCVDSVDMVLSGPNAYRFSKNEKNPPFFLFANDGDDIFGRTLATGRYTIAVTPDGNSKLAKSIAFSVKKC